jgi:hypothetical protein
MRKALLIYILNAAFAALIVCAAALPAVAWDDVGHKITAYVAWQRMSPAARENVIRVLRSAPEDSMLSAYYMSNGPEPVDTRKREYFELVATWADIVRDRAFGTRYKKYHHSNWHYDDIFWRQTGDGRIDIVNRAEEGGVAINKLQEFDRVIRDADASPRDKAIAVAWIMHLTGDIHQPLHNSARLTESEPNGDEGGNLFLLEPRTEENKNPLDLHWFWDSIVPRSLPLAGDQCDRVYVENLADRMMRKYPFAKLRSGLEVGQFEKWHQEAFALNYTDVFTPDLKRLTMPSARYKKNAYNVAEHQLVLAGYRLGETLNAVFNQPAPAK